MNFLNANAPGEGHALCCVFGKATKSLFPRRRDPRFPEKGVIHHSLGVTQSAKSLLGDNPTKDMLEALRLQQAYVLEQNRLMHQRLMNQQTTVSPQNQSHRTEQIALIRETLQGFQETMGAMIKMASDMVQKVCDAPAVSQPEIEMPSFQKSAVSHRRPAIRPIVDNGNLALKVDEDQDNVMDSNTIHVQPHPISKRLERVSEERGSE